MSKSLSGHSISRSLNEKFESERLPRKVIVLLPNEQIWRDLEDRGHIIEPYNGGHMLRIDEMLDIYPRGLKWCYTHHRNTPFRLISETSFPGEMPIQTIKRILALAPDLKRPRYTERDNSPIISRGILKAVSRYKKSI